MPKGEEIYADFVLIGNASPKGKTVVLDIPSSSQPVCQDAQLVFTDTIGVDEFKNDTTSVLNKYSPFVTAVTMVLQKKESGTYVDVDTMNDNTLGTFYALGFITDEHGNKYIGYKFNWTLIEALYEEGYYRVKFNETQLSGANTSYSQEYCLQIYHPNKADGTIRIEFYTNDKRGDITDPTQFFDFQNQNWYNSIRLDGFFGGDKSSYEKEIVEYSNGAQRYVKNDQKVSYTLSLKPIIADLHNFIKTDVLQADDVFITDYNKNNPNKHIQTPVVIDGPYEPVWNWNNKKASVSVQLTLALNNLRKKLC